MFKHINYDFPKLIRENIEGDRIYHTPDGIRYPSITTILSNHNKIAIDRWKTRVGLTEANRITKQSSVRGTSVHKALETFLNNESIVPLKLLPHSMALYIPMKRELEEHITEIHALETPLFSHKLRLAGTTDCVARYDGLLSIIDFKTSLKPKKKEWISAYFMQGVAYAEMFEELTGKPIDQVVILVGVDNCYACQRFTLLRSEFQPHMDTLISYRDKYEERMAA